MSGTLDRNGVATFSAMLLSATKGRFDEDQAQGAADAAYGRVYAHSRRTHADRSAYDLGWRVGRFVLYAAVPAWRDGMLTHADAAMWWQRFLLSRDAKPGD